MRTLTSFLLLIAILLGASRLEADYAARQWPYGWLAYPVDAVMGPTLDREPKTDTRAPLATSAAEMASRLDELALRIKTARAIEVEDWLARGLSARAQYQQQTLWTRLNLARWWALEPVTEPAAMDPRQVSQFVDRILEPLEASSAAQRNWLAGGPPESEISLRLQGKRTWNLPDGRSVVNSDRNGVVRTLAEMDRKALQAALTPQTLGRGVTVVGAGLLLIWFALGAIGRPSGWLVWIAPALLGSALLMTSLSLGALPLRSIAGRHLDSLAGWVWWPMVAVLAGIALAMLARWDRWLAPRLLAYRDTSGILYRTAALVVAAVAVPLIFGAPAVRTELWVGLALLGLGIFAARNSNVMVATDEATAFGWPIVIIAGTAIVLVAVFKKDVGSAFLATGLMAAWLIQFSRLKWALSCAVLGTAAIFWWAGQLKPAADIPVSGPERSVSVSGAGCGSAILMLLKNKRLSAACDLQISGQSDVARSYWMAKSGINHSWSGFGLVDLPANAMAARRVDRVITQLPMDYVAAPTMAAFGWLGLAGLWLYGLVILSLGAKTLATMQLASRSSLQHLLAAIAGFGLVEKALATWTTLGGALSGLPLTGTPAAALSFGPSAAIAFGLYLGLALASQPARNSRI